MQELTKHSQIDATQVPGWGVDADTDNDPTYPIKSHASGEHDGYSWERPPQQDIDIEVLHSNERPNVAATFGTTNPPSGLSGAIRRAAFNYSENSYGHWLPLIVADRVQMVEALIEDVAGGQVPNIFSELGWKAEWKYNRKALLTKIGLMAAAGITAAALVSRLTSKQRTDDHLSGRDL